MRLLTVGSVALDTVETPFGRGDDVLGGSALHFSVAASLLNPVEVVAVVGTDYPSERLEALASRGIDWSGVEAAAGESFRWSGRYSSDLQHRDTLETRLGVFADFRPRLSAGAASADAIFLGNIAPALQHEVLDQMVSPSLVACDTMNFWIESQRDALLRLLARVDLVIINDGEARELAGDWNLLRSGRWLLEQGPARVIVKKGEHGALLFEPGRVFSLPAYPLDEVMDPTGAGDAFAGGVMGYLARTGRTDGAAVRRAMVYGATMGSYSVSGFGIDGFAGVTLADVERRVAEFEDLTGVPAAEEVAS